eukprot:SM000150S01717  [mRNA]  locus=s150:236987:240741:+ [translate_table: standard]
MRERSRALRRVRVRRPPADAAAQRPQPPEPEAFVPLSREADDRAAAAAAWRGAAEVAESWEERLLRRTRDLNERTRERPRDVAVWLELARLQEERGRGRRAAQAQDKAAAVLEKALAHVPDSEDLLLAYLDTCRHRDDAAALRQKWDRALGRCSGSAALWTAFLAQQRTAFSAFSVPAVLRLYSDALAALAAHARSADGVTDAAEREKRECAAVDVLVEGAIVEWQAGHHEAALGRLQAAVEYAVFDPTLPPGSGEAGKQRLFQAFWESGAPRVGEDHALGWAACLVHQELGPLRPNEEATVEEVASMEQQPGGWSGWAASGTTQEKVDVRAGDVSDCGGDGETEHVEGGGGGSTAMEVEREEEEERGGDEGDGDDVGGDEEAALDDSEGKSEEELMEEEEEDRAALLARLGLSLAQQPADAAVKDPATWRRWAVEEAFRDARQWLPLQTSREAESRDEDVELERVVAFDDVQESLVSLASPAARAYLLAQLVAFCDGPLPPWYGTNGRGHLQKGAMREAAAGPLLDELRDSAGEGEAHRAAVNTLLGGSSWTAEAPGRAAFVRNLLMSAVRAFPSEQRFRVALLEAEREASVAIGRDGSAATRRMAKLLLKSHGQDLALWAAYARLEADAGNLVNARKVLDTALTSLQGLPKESRLAEPLLWLAYAEIELAKQATGGSQAQALHLLACLGSGRPYTTASAAAQALLSVAPALLLRARRRFQDHLLLEVRARTASSALGMDEAGVAIVACAALLEQLTESAAAAAPIFEAGLAMMLPERRRQSTQCEALWERYVLMLTASGKPGQARIVVERALAEFPHNAALMGSLARLESRRALSNRLRRFFDQAALRFPGVEVWSFAIACEAGRAGTHARMRTVLERALRTPHGGACVLLWRAYLSLELRSGPEAARRIFFRAIHACPWLSKALWLDGFKHLYQVLSAGELTDLNGVMREKDLRLRTDILEILLEDNVHSGLEKT